METKLRGALAAHDSNEQLIVLINHALNWVENNQKEMRTLENSRMMLMV